MERFLGIDLGAGSLKASLVARDGRCIASAASPVKAASPFPGASEQDPEDWWKALCLAVGNVLEQAGENSRDIAGIAVSAGAHSSVLSDGKGCTLRPAIMWNDQRSRDQVERLRGLAGQSIGSISCNAVSPTWTLPQLLWVKENEPNILEKARRLTPAKDWLRGRLTGDWQTEPVDAMGLMLYDAASGVWSEELASLAGVSPSILPPIVPSVSLAGYVTAQAAAATGLLEGTPVVTGVSDTAAEALGAGMLTPDTGVVKLATAATLSCMATGPEPSRKLVSYPYLPEASWFWITGTNSCASAHAWLRDTMFSQGGAAPLGFTEIERLAEAVPAGAEGLYFHPYLNGERAPYWDPDLRGSFVGLTFRHQPGHLLRAFYEGVAFSLADCLRQFHDAGVQLPVLRVTGGGARSAMWRQILADVLDARIELPEVADASFGCAMVAALGVGAFASPAEMSNSIRLADTCQPDPERVAFYRENFSTYREIQAALAPIHHRISATARRGFSKA